MSIVRKYGNKLSLLKKFFQYLFRLFNLRSLPIYMPYFVDLKHPFYDGFKETSLSYSNQSQAKFNYWISIHDNRFINKPFVYEVVDHISSVYASIVKRRPKYSEAIKNIELIRDFYRSDNCKLIIFQSKNHLETNLRWINDTNVSKKAIYLKPPFPSRLIKNTNKSNSLRVLYLCSDLQFKLFFTALDIALKSERSNLDIQFIFAVPENIPKNYLKNIKNLKYISKSPLSSKLKKELYSWCDIVLCPTVSDGITPFEALSFGRPYLTTRGQHMIVGKSNHGTVFDTPIDFYDNGFGTLWDTPYDYREIINTYYKENKFDTLSVEIVNCLEELREEISTTREMSLAASIHYFKNHTILKRDYLLSYYYQKFF